MCLIMIHETGPKRYKTGRMWAGLVELTERLGGPHRGFRTISCADLKYWHVRPAALARPIVVIPEIIPGDMTQITSFVCQICHKDSRLSLESQVPFPFPAFQSSRHNQTPRIPPSVSKRRVCWRPLIGSGCERDQSWVGRVGASALSRFISCGAARLVTGLPSPPHPSPPRLVAAGVWCKRWYATVELQMPPVRQGDRSEALPAALGVILPWRGADGGISSLRGAQWYP